MTRQDPASAYRALADLLDGLDANGVRVERVKTRVLDGDVESLTVSLDIEVPLDRDGRLRIPAAAEHTADGATPTTAGSVDGGTGDADPAADDSSGTVETDGADTGVGAGAENETDDAENETDDAEMEAEAGPGTGAGDAAGEASVPSDSADGAYECEVDECAARFASAAERDIHVEAIHREPETPSHRNEAALEIAYREFDSFPEMAEALDADVTPQTVRRQMMEAGIHQLDAGGDSEADESDADGSAPDDDARPEEGPPQSRRVTDGSGGGTVAASSTTDPPEPTPVRATPMADLDLPDDVDSGALRRVAVESRTLRQAAGELDLPRDRTREVLDDLGLVNLVHGRLSGRRDREERLERFEAWLAERTGTGGTVAPGASDE